MQKISFVIPCYRSEHTLAAVHEELTATRLSYIAAPLFLSFQLVNASAKKITIVCSLHHVFQPVHKAAIVAAILSANVMRATSAVAAAVPVIAVGFPSANAITYTPPSAAFLFKEMMEKYREET